MGDIDIKRSEDIDLAWKASYIKRSEDIDNAWKASCESRNSHSFHFRVYW